MGDHFVLLVDRLITESTLAAAIESQKKAMLAALPGDPELDDTPQKDAGARPGSGKLVECRICQDEDVDYSMETPCSCSGSLKHAHRKCVQRWCNEKGDTTCEICLQQFKPNYTCPPKLFRYGRIPMNFRGNWEISRRDIHNQQFITMVPTNRDFMGSSSYDDYASSSARSIMYCRSVAIIFMILLVLRHVLPVMINGAEEHYSLALFMLLLLRTAGIVIPLYVMLRAVTTFQRRRLQQDTRELPMAASGGENVGIQP